MTAKCAKGEKATGGGYSPLAGESTSFTASGAPAPVTGTPTGWTFDYSATTFSQTETPAPETAALRVVCAG